VDKTLKPKLTLLDSQAFHNRMLLATTSKQLIIHNKFSFSFLFVHIAASITTPAATTADLGKRA
jgi:hypothetical protein